MIKKIILIACFVALVLVGRNVIKRYPEANKLVNSKTKELRKCCKTSWKTTQKFYTKNLNGKAMSKSLKTAKAPFSNFMKEKNKKKSASNRPSNFTVVNGAPPPTAKKTAHN